jgi:hypothetical protein
MVERRDVISGVENRARVVRATSGSGFGFGVDFY